MKIFDTVAKMKLASLKTGQIVKTKGKITLDDRLGEEYLIAAPVAVDEVNDFALANSNVALNVSKRVRDVDTYADIRALTASYPFETIIVGGANVVGVGGGTFYYDSGDVSSADNGATVLVDAAGRRWKRGDISSVIASMAGVVGDGSDETAALSAAIQAAEGGALDLEGLEISITSITSTLSDSIRIFSSKAGAKITSIGAANKEFVLKITFDALSSLQTENFAIDGTGLAAKGLFIATNVLCDEWLHTDVTVENCTQTASTGLAAGVYLSGGFNRVIATNPVSKNITSTGGSLISSGIRMEANGSVVSEIIDIINPHMENISPGNDGDGLALLQPYPFTVNGQYSVYGGAFKNCHKRAVKTQCYRSMVDAPYIYRDVVHVVAAGNVDIDIQYGNGVIIDPVFEYATGATAPAGGLISLSAQRGITTNASGKSTEVLGGTATIHDPAIRLSQVFALTSFATDDVINLPLVQGFKFNGAAEVSAEIRPVASATFNRNIVYQPTFRDCQFDDISDAFFRIDRSGTGYAFTTDANIINTTVQSGAIPLDDIVTSQVGITYDFLKRNDNIKDLRSTYYTFSDLTIADNATFSHIVKIPSNSSVEITALYASGAGDNYHAHRKSIIHCGNGAGEDLETNLFNLASAFGGWSFTMTPALVSSFWEITVTKPVGVSATVGSFQIIAECANGVGTS